MNKLSWIRFPAAACLAAGFLFFPLQAQNYRLTEGAKSIRMQLDDHSVPYQVFTGSAKPDPDENRHPVLGKYFSDGDTLEFTPVIAFRKGMSYTVILKNDFWFSFSIPTESKLPLPELTAIYPSADTVPDNLLKMYLHFSAPMREGVAYSYLIIVNEKGDTLSKPFLELEPELWDISGQRLTLWFDPGRVKRALGPNEMAGTPLTAGSFYTLFVLKEWPDLHGQQMKVTSQKSFYVEVADRVRPRTSKWTLSPPEMGSREPLLIDFGESMDHALAMHTLSVINKRREMVAGKVQLSAHERKWFFYPDQAWEEGLYQVQAEARLEDLAGNNLNRLFDRDLKTEPQEYEEKDFYMIDFQINRRSK